MMSKLHMIDSAKIAVFTACSTLYVDALQPAMMSSNRVDKARRMPSYLADETAQHIVPEIYI